MNKQELIEYAEQQVADYESKARLFPEAREYAVREYAEGAISGTALLISEIKKLDEPKKVKVPLFVAKWISKCRELNWILPDLLAPEAFESSFARNTEEWLRQDKHNYDILARAWLDGYEVEEEPRYKVIMPNPQSKNGNLLVLRRNQRGTITVNKVKANTARSGEGMDLTEKEIKSVDERYWPFAVPVEKV